MASITIRNMDPEVKARLRVRAAQHNRSMEEEVRVILRDVTFGSGKKNASFLDVVREAVEPYGGFELELPLRDEYPNVEDID